MAKSFLDNLLSLDTPEAESAPEVLTDIGAGFLPFVGTAQAVRDFERSRRDKDKLGMGLAALGAFPVIGGLVKPARKLGKAGLSLFHGSPNNAMRLEDIQVFGGHSRKQNKRGSQYGGFYTSGADRISDAERYAGEAGTVYRVDLTPDAVIEEIPEEISRLSKERIDELRSRGVSVVTGKDVRGRQEYVVIDESVIAGFSPNTPTPNMATGGPVEIADLNPAKRRRLI
jgi:hypothetical protein